ncbi:MAG: M24 family metallopeptidase [bacterium]
MGFNSKEISLIAAEIIEKTFPEIDLNISIEKEEYSQRWKKVQEVMKQKGYDLGYACGSELDRSDVAWLAGVFDPIIERYGILIPQNGVPIVLAGSEGGHVLEEAVETSGADIALLKELQISDEDYRHAHFSELDGIIKKLDQKINKVVIFSSQEFIPLSQVEIFQKKFGKENVIFDPKMLQLIKYEKSDKELSIMSYANIIADAAFRGALAVVKSGVTELQVAGVADYIMKELGAGRIGFPTIVTSGQKRGYTVIGPATNNFLKEGDIVSIGLSPTFKGYHGIIRRTVKVGGNLTEMQQDFIKAVEGLYITVIKAVKEASLKNLPSNFVDQKGKEYLKELKITSLSGEKITPLEPYTFVHNSGCSECQEGYGAITPYTENKLGEQVSLMVDVALLGFKERGKPLFDILYGVVEDAFWKKVTEVGVYNKLPLNVQHLVGNNNSLGENINSYYKKFSI